MSREGAGALVRNGDLPADFDAAYDRVAAKGLECVTRVAKPFVAQLNALDRADIWPSAREARKNDVEDHFATAVYRGCGPLVRELIPSSMRLAAALRDRQAKLYAAVKGILAAK